MAESSKTRMLIGAWSCARCTYHHEATASRCVICSSLRFSLLLYTVCDGTSKGKSKQHCHDDTRRKRSNAMQLKENKTKQSKKESFHYSENSHHIDRNGKSLIPATAVDDVFQQSSPESPDWRLSSSELQTMKSALGPVAMRRSVG
jgi:hypothetical protein